MNREKKQLVVVGVLATLILGVGAFQFTRGEEKPPTAEKPKPVADKKAKDGDAKPTLKYPELFDMQPKDPFTTAGFVTAGNAPEVKVPTPTPPIHPLPDPSNTAIDHITPKDWKIAGDPKDKGIIEPAPVPVKPVFGYTLVGIIEGAHPAAVFDDGKGNQQLVEVGQGVGSSATILSISRGKVRVKFNAETLTFNVGGNPNAK